MDQWSAIREKAALLLSEYERRSHKPAFSATRGSYRCLDDLAGCCCSLTVADDPDLPDNVLGQLAIDEGEGTIRVRAGLGPARRAFVIGHEIGHFALKHPARQIQDGPEQIDESPHTGALVAQNGIYRAYSERDRWELEANVFAAELLAPVLKVREMVLNDRDWTVEDLAKYFGLSEAAILNQLAAALLPGPMPLAAVTAAKQPPPMDDFQERAATVAAPALILAGPGAGKTRVLVERFVHLVRQGTDPRRILALTFANKAAEEMRERLATALPDQAHLINVATFHSLGLELLQAYGHAIGTSLPLQILTPVDAFVLLRANLNTLNLGHFEDLHQPTSNLRDLLGVVSRAKDELCDPAQFDRLVQDWQSDLAKPHPPEDAGDQEQDLKLQKDNAAICADISRFYDQYQACLQNGGFLDYGDLIAEAVRLFEDAEVGTSIRSCYEQILVDEFQDINYASGRLVWNLDGGRGVVWAVGDPRQSIYRFRGASPANLLGFSTDYPGAQVIPLEMNYRSVEGIVRAGQAVQIPLPTQGGSLPVPHLHSHRGRPLPGPALEVAVAATEVGETHYLVDKVKHLAPTVQLRDIVVLCRTRAHAQKVADALEIDGIPSDWGGDLEERALFKDLMGVLLLATGDPHGLVRLGRMPEHYLSETDLRLLLKVIREQRHSLHIGLRLAAAGKIEGISAEGITQVRKLRRLSILLRRERTPWQMLSTYLFKYADWARNLFGQSSAVGSRSLSTLGQLANLGREFAHRSTIAGGNDTSAFLDFVQSSLEAGELGVPDEALVAGDAVQVMTVHRSKGLEWPVVLVPNLAEGRFPSRERASLVLPPGLIHGSQPSDAQMEEACLFYVAVTRARDHLVLTRAEKYGKQRFSASPHLEGLISQLEPSGHLFQLAIDTEPAVAMPVAETAEQIGLTFEGPIPLSLIRTYDRCALRLKYEEAYGLRSPEQGYRKFHQVIYQIMTWIAQESADGQKPAFETMVQKIDQEWEATGLHEHWFGGKFRQFGEQIILAFAERLRPGVSVEVRQAVSVSIGEHIVTFRVDEVETNDQTTTWRRHHLSRPAKSHETDDMPSLYSLAYQEGAVRSPEQLIQLHYPLTGEEKNIAPTKVVLGNRAKKIATLIAQIQAGDFPAQPGKHCETCPHVLICPA